MSFRLDVYHHFPREDDDSPRVLEQLIGKVSTLIEKVNHMSVELDRLAEEVAANTTVDQSAIALLNGLSAQLAAIANDPAAITALSEELAASSAALAAAVAANTPAAPVDPVA